MENTQLITTQPTILGLDIAKDKVDCALLRLGKVKSKVIQNSPQGFVELAAWLERHDVHLIHACCEATGVYWEAVALFLFEAGHHVSVVNPAQIHAFGQSRLQRNKTDGIDAALIAAFCDTSYPPLWQPPPFEERTLQAMIRDLQTLQDMQRAESNRLLVAHASVKPRIQRHLDWLAAEIARLEQDIDQHIDQYPELKSRRALLTSVPGIGKRLSSWFLVMLGNGQRFNTSKQAVAFTGLSPRLWQSGSSVRGKTRISKVGSGSLRRLLYMPAVSAYAKLDIYQPFIQRLKLAGKPPKVIIVAIMRKLVAIAQAVLKANKPFDKNIYQKACLL
ncbi:IS110 family transposase [Methylophilus sp. 5]|uniref:IS110 family transposase n=1 Tax=Methylophilus sp. 5 TaxID=1112274 RepID=UPI0004BAEC63|nr:IS110 family transposase [Methylophilus sp. 5]